MQRLQTSVEVYNIYLPDHRAELSLYRSFLSTQELDRAATFLRPKDAEGFVLGRGLLRQILSGYRKANPSELRFTRNAQGKPFLEEGDLDFNLSHSHERLLIAVTCSRAVGVDMEFQRTGLNRTSIAKRWFAPEEAEFFEKLDRPEAVFFEIWAKKEAYVKALGRSIYKDSQSFSVPLGEVPFSPVLGRDPGWFFQTLPVDADYAAAVVAKAPIVPIHLRTF